MLQIEKWAQDKPITFTLYALAIIRPALATSNALQSIKDGGLQNQQITLPPLPEWLSLYRNHRDALNYMLSYYPDNEDDLLGNIGSMATGSQSEKENKFQNLFHENEGEHVDAYRALIKSIKNEIASINQISNSAENQETEEFFMAPIGLFMMKVWLPC
jgi:hypothetical protein